VPASSSNIAIRLRESITAWWRGREIRSVDFHEFENPQSDPDSRFTVTYEAVFEPRSLDQARLELWITEAGEVAIGFETRDRVASRLGVRNRRQGFAAGHEPREVSERWLREAIEMVALGDIAVAARTIPLVGLSKTIALVAPPRLATLQGLDPVAAAWLKGATAKVSAITRLVRYERWQ
jgi:hypothetical protein